MTGTELIPRMTNCAPTAMEIAAPIINAAAPAGGPLNVALSSGDNTLAVPQGAQGFVFVPPSSSVVAKKLKGVAGVGEGGGGEEERPRPGPRELAHHAAHLGGRGGQTE